MARFIDYLREDKHITGQQWALISFLSKNSVEGYKGLGDEKFQAKKDEIMSRVQELQARAAEIPELAEAMELVEESFGLLEKKEFQGMVKFRGAFGDEDEARKYAKQLEKEDPDFHIFVGDITGKWVPFDPQLDDECAIEEEYGDEELNKMMKNYKKQRAEANQQYEQRKDNMMKEALLDQKKERAEAASGRTNKHKKRGKKKPVQENAEDRDFADRLKARMAELEEQEEVEVINPEFAERHAEKMIEIEDEEEELKEIKKTLNDERDLLKQYDQTADDLEREIAELQAQMGEESEPAANQ